MGATHRAQRTLTSDPPVPTATATGHPTAFFITGTGRCGTMLLARLFSLSPGALCEHERYFRHQSMVDFYMTGNPSGFTRDIEQGYDLHRQEHRRSDRLLGVSSGHLYFAIPLLHEAYGAGSRFILLVRRPDAFARSALARGFFDPTHPSFCDQIRPCAQDPICQRWDQATPLERTLWYWSLVNGSVIKAFQTMPASLWRIVRIEDMTVTMAHDLFRFVGLPAVPDQDIRALLARRVNATPDNHAANDVNPFSKAACLPAVEHWTGQQRELLVHYTGPLYTQLYPPAET